MMIKDKKAIGYMREGGNILAIILKDISSKIKEGMNASLVDIITNRSCLKHGVKPAFKGYKPSASHGPYPSSICVSINDEIVHGLPVNKKIKNGDIVSLDFGVIYKGYITDAAVTVGVGEISNEDKKLISVTRGALDKGIQAIKAGARVGDISESIQRYVEKNGFNVFKSLAGHGVGKTLHEDPTIPNYGKRGTGEVLKEGMTLAIETMVTPGKGELTIAEDGWTMKTHDGQKAAQFEHTVLVTDKGYEILTK